MSTAAQSQGFSASVRVENEEPIALNEELTSQLRQFAVLRAEAFLLTALDLLNEGLGTQEETAAFAKAAREASRYAEVVYTLTLGPDWGDDTREEV